MNEVMEVQSLEDVCRLCLSADEAKSSIFGVPNSTMSLADKIQVCLSIQISTSDRLSTLICSNCIRNVNRWHAYKELCLRSQEKLQQWLAKQLPCNPAVIQIKEEPVDLDYPVNHIEISHENNDQSDLVDINNTISVHNNAEVQSQENTIDKQVMAEEIPPKTSKARALSPLRENNITDKQSVSIQIKTEPLDEFSETDSMMDIDTISEGELLLNPMAMAKAKDIDRVAEADSTQKFGSVSVKIKKKMRRGPKIYFRGTKIYKRKCDHCQINLHSKYSYMNHMARFHNFINKVPQSVAKSKTSKGALKARKRKTPQTKFVPPPIRTSARIANEVLAEQSTDEEEEMIEDVEDELVSLEKDAPLTPVQQNIISQLKTFSCYACQQYFFDRRSTLNHIRQHMPDLRPYTCIACLTEFADRSMYKLHCGESFECAMKIALVIPKYGTEKYFTCNMCLRPMSNRQELISHLSKHSDKQYEQLVSPSAPKSSQKISPMRSQNNETLSEIPGPYMNGDPEYNHKCDLCGMIYKRKPNMFKHRDLCATLKPEVRTSYKCVHCGMTFLVFKKFQSHLMNTHRKKDFTCHICRTALRSPDEYLVHHNNHRDIAPENNSTDNSIEDESSTQKHNCALCGEQFSNRADLSEHRNLHLKVKIYSCVICRSMFSSPGALEVHMKDHGIEDPNEQTVNSSCQEYNQHESLENDADTSSASQRSNTQCPECNKTFSNFNNVKRHLRDVHHKIPYDCPTCSIVFNKREQLNEHLKSHQQTKKPILSCPKCPKTFIYPAYMSQHCLNVHGFTWNGESIPATYDCDICDRQFTEENSLKVHRGWHSRQSNLLLAQTANAESTSLQNNSVAAASTPKPAKARKSFPKPVLVPVKQMQCQVCDDSFADVTELRKHVWDVHCARSKQEKPFIENELQCQLCTNIFQDKQTLDNHMAWHRANPILGGQAEKHKTFPCDLCSKVYVTRKMLYKHKKMHKIMSMQPKKKSYHPICDICGRAFSSASNMNKHKQTVHGIQNAVRTKKEPGTSFVDSTKKKPVTCLLCKIVFPSMRVLYQHKQLMHNTHQPVKQQKQKSTLVPLSGHEGSVCCNICGKQFPGMANLKQHFTLKHKTGGSHRYMCPAAGCSRQYTTQQALKAHDTMVHSKPKEKYTCIAHNCWKQFSSPKALRAHEHEKHKCILYNCNLCKRHFFHLGIMEKHLQNTHKADYQTDSGTNPFFTETDLTSYEIKGLQKTRECPRCKIMYPNTKSLKVHFFKEHERKGLL